MIQRGGIHATSNSAAFRKLSAWAHDVQRTPMGKCGKRWFGYTHFLVKGLEAVRGDWTLITLSEFLAFPRRGRESGSMREPWP